MTTEIPADSLHVAACGHLRLLHLTVEQRRHITQLDRQRHRGIGSHPDRVLALNSAHLASGKGAQEEEGRMRSGHHAR